MRPSDVVVSCVCEDRPEWYRMVENLALSLRNFGGRLAQARFVAYAIDAGDRPGTPLLASLGVEVRPAPHYFRGQPTTNKLRMFEDFAARGDGELLVALDCDTVVVRDFWHEVRPNTLRAMAAGRSPMTSRQWEDLAASLGLTLSQTPTTMLESGEELPAPYLNSGVLFVPGSLAAELTTAWKNYVDLFAQQMTDGVDEPWTGYMLDQVALACALLDRSLPVEPLGPDLNLPTGISLVGQTDRFDIDNVAILHYHRHISAAGRLLPNDEPRVDALIQQVNAVVSARRGEKRLEGVAHGVRGALGRVRKLTSPG